VLDYAVCHWIVLYTVHFTAFCLGGGFFFPGHGVVSSPVLADQSNLHNVSIKCFMLCYCPVQAWWFVQWGQMAYRTTVPGFSSILCSF